jgi:PAS domain S-box-containing protein
MKINEYHSPLIEAIQQAVVITDLNGIITLWNEYAEKLYGWTTQEVLGKNIFDLNPPILTVKDAKKIVTKLTKGESFSGEFNIQNKTGEYIYIYVTDSAIKDEKGNFIGIVCIANDITERKKQDEMLQFLTHASKQLGSSLEYETTLKNLSNLVVPTLADWCSIDVIDEDGSIKQLSLSHIHANKIKFAKELRKNYPADLSIDSNIERVIKTGKSKLYSRISEKILDKTTPNKDALQVSKHMGLISIMIIPLIVRNKTRGAISFITTKESNRVYNKHDLQMAEEFARRAAFALENARLYRKAQLEIKERKKAEEKIKQLAAMVESSQDAIIGCDLHGIITTWNLGAEKLYGYKAKEAVGKHISFINPHDDPKQFETFTQKLLQGKQIEHYQTTRVNKKGHIIDVSVTVSPVKDDHNTIIGISSIARNISDHKKLEEELQESRDQLEVILQNVTDGITVLDPTGKLIFANDAAAKLIGFPNAIQLLEANTTYIIDRFDIMDEHGQLLDRKQLPSYKALQGEEEPEVIVKYIVKNTGEEMWSIIKSTPVFDEDNNVIFAINVFRDITEQKMREKRKDEFISIASHELKTPLTSIKAFTQLLDRYFKQKDDKQAIAYLTRMIGQVERLTNLVDDLLDVSKIQAGKFILNEEVFNFDEMINDMINEIQPTTDDHTILKKGSADVLVFADKYRVAQVLINLLTNAIKYSPKADQIIVHTSTTPDEVTVAVQDFGLGISADKQHKVFERFYRVEGKKRDSYPGLGLGLYISQQIMKRHNGKLWVESDEGKGSTFYFSLPITLRSRLVHDTSTQGGTYE